MKRYKNVFLFILFVLSNSLYGNNISSSDSLITYSIPQGGHRSSPASILTLKTPQKLEWEVQFDENCAYTLGDEDQMDCNKLCGIAFYENILSALLGTINSESPQHTESARIGWRWNDKTEKIELLGYYYIGTKRKIEPICEVRLNQRFSVMLEIDYQHFEYKFSIKKKGKCKKFQQIQQFEHHYNNAYLLGFYFGGNKVAPHSMSVKMQLLTAGSINNTDETK